MKTFSVAEQVASHLREGLQQGKWTGVMPGRDRLARELGVHGSTVERALGQLEQEGLLQSGGPGKRRKIAAKKIAPGGTRVVILLYEPEDVLDHRIAEIQQHLHAAGHRPSFASKAMSELKHDPKRIMAMMKAHPAEAWIVLAAARSVLQILSETSTPTFALFGAMSNLRIAGTGARKIEALGDCIDHLYRKGCRRIVMLIRGEGKTTGLNMTGRVFFEELNKRNLSQSSYNLPEWENTPDGLHRCLDELFKVTPPDAILVDDWILLYAIQRFISHKRGLAFRQVECVTTDYHPSFKWCQPAVPHFYWDHTKVVRRVVQWVDHVAQGKEDRKVKLIEARFVPGG
jgi:DNA-binding LacI/PurR family transcriptional regulator